MRHADNSDLLTPSLQNDSTMAVYSVGALIAAAFFGGGVAVVIMGTLNAYRLGRLGRDAILLIGMLLLSVGTLVAMIEMTAGGDTARTARLVNRGLGFVLCGALYLLHQRAFKAMNFLGLDKPSPYVPVIAAIVVSILVTMGVFAALEVG
ncbi:MAG: hypothetical protein AAGC71_13150 [Pseudomonadota bacterium]